MGITANYTRGNYRIFLGIVLAIAGIIFLIQSIYYLESAILAYQACLGSQSHRSEKIICSFQLDFLRFAMPGAAFISLACWIIHSYLRRKSLRRRLPMLTVAIIVIASSLIALTNEGVTLFLHYLQCISNCSTGSCGGASSTAPTYDCALPILEFVLPISFLVVGGVLLALQFRISESF